MPVPRFQGSVSGRLFLRVQLFPLSVQDVCVHQQQAFQGKACNFTPYWVKAAQRDGFRSVIYYQVDSGKRFKGPYVAAFSADYSSLHLVGRKIYNADHCVRRKFNTAALDCGCNNFLSFTICITLSTFFQFFSLRPIRWFASVSTSASRRSLACSR